MSRSDLVIVDICNTLANVNEQLNKRGYRTDSFPCEAPPQIWNDERIFREAEPIRPILYFVRRLSEVATIVYLTARPQKFHEVTEDWLKRYNAPSAPTFYTEGRTKGEIVKNILRDADQNVIVFEDSPAEIESILELMPDVSLFIPDWDYNRHIKGNRLDII